MPGTAEALALFLYLLPGVIGFFVFEMLSDSKPSSSYSRVGATTAFAFASVLVVSAFTSQPVLPVIEDPAKTSVSEILNHFMRASLLPVFVVAIALGALSAWTGNRGLIFKVLKCFRITYQTGKVDVWHQVFITYRAKWLRVRLKSGKQLVGWPAFYSLTSEKGPMLFLAEATWSWPKNEGGTVEFESSDVDGPGVLISSLDDVESIEFLEGD